MARVDPHKAIRCRRCGSENRATATLCWVCSAAFDSKPPVAGNSPALFSPVVRSTVQEEADGISAGSPLMLLTTALVFAGTAAFHLPSGFFLTLLFVGLFFATRDRAQAVLQAVQGAIMMAVLVASLLIAAIWVSSLRH